MSETIDLDCPPGATRPWDLIASVVADTPIVLKPCDTEPGHTFFGARTWSFDIPRDVWERDVQPIIKPRIVALHEAGIIRYGSW